MNSSEPARRGYQRIALACQGGGALGAYHIGMYQAMSEAGYLPDVVSGISIGAFTAAVIAGNAPEDRLAKLHDFWKAISWPDLWSPLGTTPGMQKMQATLGFLQAAMFGQPNFFSPLVPMFKLQLPLTLNATSYYDTSAMHDTLQQFVHFDRINANKTRLLLGAVRVKDGVAGFFDSAKSAQWPIGSEHVIASGSLPPGFPGTRIEGKLYWDGGCVSNTPIEAIYDLQPAVPTLVFMIDLFNPEGKEPEDMDAVMIRQTEILYASRTAHHIHQINQRSNLSRIVSRLIPPEQHGEVERWLRAAEEQRILPSNVPGAAHQDPFTVPEEGFLNDELFDVVHVVFDPPADTKILHGDADFSRSSIEARAAQGYANMREALTDLQEQQATRQHQAALKLEAAPALRSVLGEAAPPPVQSTVFKVGRRRN